MKQFFILLSLFCFSSMLKSQNAGVLDSTFGVNARTMTSLGKGDNAAYAVVVQPDGKIVAAGFSTKDSIYSDRFSLRQQTALARYNRDGLLDDSFGVNGKVIAPLGSFGTVNGLALQTDGKIVAIGEARDSADINVYGIIRYQSNGAIDSSFGNSGRVKINCSPLVVTIQPDGKILVGGVYSYYDVNFHVFFVVARYNTNGMIDSSFNSTGIVFNDVNPTRNNRISGISLQTDNKIVICGTSKYVNDNDIDVIEPSEMIIMRYNSNGSLDNNFGTNGIVRLENAVACAVKVLPSGKILVAGNEHYMGSNFVLRRLNTNGTIDATFNFDAPTVGKATDMVVQTDNKIIIVGQTFNSNLNAVNFTLMRCNSEGVLDNSFGSRGKTTTPPIYKYERYSKIALQNDKIIACGSSKFGGQFNFNLMRYNNASIATENKELMLNKNAFLIYPNPANNNLLIKMNELNSSDLSLKIVDISGRIVLHKNFDLLNKYAPLDIDIQHFTAGLYVVEIITADRKWAQLFSKY